MATVKVTVRKNGSLRVEAPEGEIELLDGDGNPYDLTGKTSFSLPLRRFGESSVLRRKSQAQWVPVGRMCRSEAGSGGIEKRDAIGHAKVEVAILRRSPPVFPPNFVPAPAQKGLIVYPLGQPVTFLDPFWELQSSYRLHMPPPIN